jgi:Galactose oxidase, central domain
MVYDAATRTSVLFGGQVNNVLVNETWTWNGTTWTLQHPRNSPSARGNQGMAYDEARRVVVLFGGVNIAKGGRVQDLGDTWTWDGTNWVQQRVSGPSVREQFPMTYDSARGVTVLFGGEQVGNYQGLGDTWTWNGTAWSQLSPTSSPPNRLRAGMAYDAFTGTSILFGGQTCCSGGLSYDLNDTWTWNGSNWIQASPATPPTARDFFSMVYDQATQTIVLFGGEPIQSSPLNDTWSY